MNDSDLIDDGDVRVARWRPSHSQDPINSRQRRQRATPACLVVLSLIGFGCNPRSPHALSASGTLEMTEVYLSPSVPGRLATLTVKEGDPVKKGQRLGTLNRFEQAERDLKRLQSLRASGEAAHQQVERAELDWEDQQLVSPIDGLVMVRVSEPGEGVSPGIPAVVLGNPADVWMKVYVSEKEIGRVTLGQKAKVSIDAFPDRSFSGRVTFISPKAQFTPKNIQTKEERVTQMFAVKVSMDQPEGILKPGMPADCTLE